MKCAHCCFSCTGSGSDISMEDFQLALKLTPSNLVNITGGEPTLHPLYWIFIDMTLAAGKIVTTTTNGKKAKDALKIARMAREGILYGALSLDRYHESISEEVKRAFLSPRSKNDKRKIKSNDVPAWEGRAKNLEIYDNTKCCCEDAIMYLNGDVYACGCKTIKLGTLKGGFSIPSWHEIGFCANSILSGQFL
jgi:hypothetical protein